MKLLNDNLGLITTATLVLVVISFFANKSKNDKENTSEKEAKS